MQSTLDTPPYPFIGAASEARAGALRRPRHWVHGASAYYGTCRVGSRRHLLAQLSLGHRTVMVAGGMESLSNSPFTLPRGQTPYGGMTLTDTCNQDGLTDAYSGWHMGKCAEVGILTGSFTSTLESSEHGTQHGDVSGGTGRLRVRKLQEN